MELIVDELFHGVARKIHVDSVCIVRDVGLQLFVVAIFCFYLEGFLIIRANLNRIR